ncbi:MAG TPA: hypothetical protein VN838_04945 [Bradyrhizobium sp.]|nr:hypothetical protein [Bradyrhizobium sp.]
MRSLSATLLIVALFGAGLVPARAQQFETQGPPPFSPPFVATLSNNTPLAFGMNEQDAANALGTPLTYIRGRPGDEIYLAFRHAGGTGFFNRKDRLYLQFRHGRLAGWKGDWGRNCMWQ